MKRESYITERNTEKLQNTAVARLMLAFLGAIFVINAFILDRIMGKTSGLGDISAFLGAILLAAPLVFMAVRDLIRGHIHMTELAAVAVLASFALGDFKVSGVIAFFLLASELIETRTALGAQAAVESLIRLTPTVANVIGPDGNETEREAHLLNPGEHVRVRPGDNIPADGKVVSGEGTVNQASITGESIPVDKLPGDTVFAGTQNSSGTLEIEVTQAGTDTTLGKVRRLILEAELTKTPLMSFVDKYAGYYTPLMLIIALLVVAFTQDLSRAITVLVIVCPCAFILATPTAIVAGLATAARLGILIKNVRDLERAGQLDAFIFDKTGTLTTGQLAVVRVGTQPGIEAEDLLRKAASLEHFSNHPVAKAVVNVAREAEIEFSDVKRFKEIAGKGVLGEMNGASVMVGRDSWLEEEGINLGNLPAKITEEASGYSILYVASNGKVIGWLGLEDRTRPEAREAIRELRENGVQRTVMITGDRETIARRVAEEMVCSEYQAEALPKTKLDLVESLKREGYTVAVVGDGVNDAPALAAGDIGIAMGAAGSDVALNSASIALMNNELNRLPFLLKLSRKVRWVVNQNLLVGLFFVVGGITFATLGYLNPIAAAVLHNIGSFIVIFNSARLVRYGEEFTPHAELVKQTS
jgi:Zn2+/Cd2+-exporting ATPase